LLLGIYSAKCYVAMAFCGGFEDRRKLPAGRAFWR
jgi:hypothetical protein